MYYQLRCDEKKDEEIAKEFSDGFRAQIVLSPVRLLGTWMDEKGPFKCVHSNALRRLVSHLSDCYLRQREKQEVREFSVQIC